MEKETQVTPAAGCKPAGRPRANELEARQQNLIETAGHLFLKHGYSKVSLETIAREAHVAVRTIYVKFGGKAGLFQAVLVHNRDKFFTLNSMETDTRPIRDVVAEFAAHFLDMIAAPAAVTIQRMVLAEAGSNPELARSFFDAGPRLTRDMIKRYFDRPDIRAQLRDDLDTDLLPLHLTNCVIGDQFERFLFGPPSQTPEEVMRDLERRLDLFYRAVLKT